MCQILGQCHYPLRSVESNLAGLLGYDCHKIIFSPDLRKYAKFLVDRWKCVYECIFYLEGLART